MRPWVPMTELAVPFRERTIAFTPDFRSRFRAASPSGRLPVLLEGDGSDPFTTWETTAIVERLAELAPHAGIWPVNPHARAIARNLCSEMQAGFKSIRATMPFNVRAQYLGEGVGAETQADIASAADAYYVPIPCRFRAYGVELPAAAPRYADRLLDTPGVRDWTARAEREENYFVLHEPYDLSPPAGSAPREAYE